MKRYKKIIRRGLILPLLLALAFGAAVTAFAGDAEDLNFGIRGSVMLTLKDSAGNAVTGGEITIYEVASLYLDSGGEAEYDLTDEFDGCTAVLDVEDTSLAETLALYVEDNGIDGTIDTVGEDGTVIFEELSLGLYLIVQTSSRNRFHLHGWRIYNLHLLGLRRQLHGGCNRGNGT